MIRDDERGLGLWELTLTGLSVRHLIYPDANPVYRDESVTYPVHTQPRWSSRPMHGFNFVRTYIVQTWSAHFDLLKYNMHTANTQRDGRSYDTYSNAMNWLENPISGCGRLLPFPSFGRVSYDFRSVPMERRQSFMFTLYCQRFDDVGKYDHSS